MATEVGRGVIPVGVDKSGVDRGLRGIESSTKSRFKRLGKTALLGFGTAVSAATVLATKFGGEYVSSLNKIQALSGANDTQMKKVAKTLEGNKNLYALMGQTTGDAANGVVELVKAGLTLDKSLKAVNATMILAKAGELGVADASTLVSNTLNTFGLNARRAGDIANYLANAANISSADVVDLGEALKFVSPVAAASGVSLKTTSAILAELANAGIKGTLAGTGLRKFLLSLSAPAGLAAKQLKALGVSVFDAGGKMRPIQALIGDLGKALDNVSAKERTKALRDIFGLTGITSAQVILKNGVKGLADYEKGITRAGAAQALAESQSKGLLGTLNRLKAITISYAQAAYRVLSPIVDRAIKPLVDGFASLGSRGSQASGFFNSLARVVKKIIPPVREFAERLMGVVGPGLSQIAALVKSDLVPAFQRIAPILAPIGKFLLTIFGAALIGVVKGAINIIKGLVKVISGVLNLITGLVHGDWALAWEGLKQIVSGALQGIIGIIQVWWNAGILAIFKRGIVFLTKGIWQAGWKQLAKIGESATKAITKTIRSGLSAIGRVFVAGVKGYIAIWRAYFKAVFTIVKTGWKVLRSAFDGAVAALRSIINGFWSLVRAAFTRGWAAVKKLTTSAWSAVKGIVAKGVKTVVDGVRSLPGRLLSLVGKMRSAGARLIQSFIDGLAKVGGVASGFANAIWNAVKATINAGIGRLNSLLEFSIKVGPKSFTVNPPDIGYLAKGTRDWRGGLAVVGERGPELVRLPRHSQVIPAPRVQAATRAMEADREAMGGVNVQVDAPQNTDPHQVGDIVAGRVAAILKGAP